MQARGHRFESDILHNKGGSPNGGCAAGKRRDGKAGPTGGGSAGRFDTDVASRSPEREAQAVAVQ